MRWVEKEKTHSNKLDSIGITMDPNHLHHLALASAIRVRNHLNVQTPAKIAIALVEFILVTS
jgi:hypothetical protein